MYITGDVGVDWGVTLTIKPRLQFILHLIKMTGGVQQKYLTS